MNFAFIALLSVVVASPSTHSQQVVFLGETGWQAPAIFEWTIDTPLPNVFATNNTINSSEWRVLADRACVAWSRVGLMSSRCRATRVQAFTPSTLSWWFPGLTPFSGTSTMGFVPPPGSGANAMAVCFAYGIGECDVWYSNTTTWRTNLSPTGSVLDTQGDATTPNLYITTLHEIGHALGSFHPVQDLSPQNVFNQVSCPPAGAHVNYPCPVMSASRLQRKSWWPSYDDWDVMHRHHQPTDRRIEWALYTLDNSGSLIRLDGWNPLFLANSSGDPILYYGTPLNLIAKTPPRVSCRPDAGNGELSCQLAIGHHGNKAVRFHALDVSIGAAGPYKVLAREGISGGRWAEGAVDTAYGDLNRVFGVGKRPAFRSNSSTLDEGGKVVVYGGTVNGSISSNITAFYTHTEPRVSYSETTCHFVAAWPERNGKVRVTSYDLSGSQKDTTLIEDTNPAYALETVWPVDVVCDAHLPGSDLTCKIYVMEADGSGNASSGRFKTFPLTLSLGSSAVNDCSSTDAGRGLIATPAGGWASVGSWNNLSADALIVDTASYGNWAVSGEQTTGAAYLITTDAHMTNLGTNLGRVRIDRNGLFNGSGALIDSSAWSVSNTGAVGLTNTMSWDWNETARRFVVIRLGPQT